MSEPLYFVEGYGADLEVFEDKLTIKRKGVGSFFIHGIKGEKTLFFQNITAIQFKKASLLTSGYMQLSLPGSNESKGGIFAAVKDENTFVFKGERANELMEEVKSYIEQKRMGINKKPSSQISIADEIRKFKELLDDAVLTQEEFDKKKQELLGGNSKKIVEDFKEQSIDNTNLQKRFYTTEKYQGRVPLPHNIENLKGNYEFKEHQKCQGKITTDESEPVKVEVTDKSGKQPVGWGWVLSWIFGIVFLFGGLRGFFEGSMFEGLCQLTIFLLLLPPIREYVYSKTNKKIPMIVKVLLILVLSLGINISSDKNKVEPIGLNQTTRVKKTVKKQKPLTKKSKTVTSRNEYVSQSYEIQVSAKPILNDEVKFNVQTNIPLPVKVAVSIGLKGQKPSDIYIGEWGEHVELKKSNQTFVIDIKDSDLPSGIYIAEVTFYPRWGAKNGSPRAKKIKTVITGTSEITLQGTGETIKSVQQKDKKQTWVMSNVIMGTLWDRKKFIDKLGNYEELKVTKWNPNIIKAYYFPKADMTFVVNIYSDTIETWRMGKQPE